MTLTANLTRQFPVCGMSVTVADGSIVTARLIQVVSADVQTGQADSGKITVCAGLKPNALRLQNMSQHIQD